MRYRRNLLAVSALVIAVSLFPEIDWNASTPFGFKFKGDALASAGLIAWTVLFFYAVNFVVYGYHETRAWVGTQTSGDNFPELRMYFGFLPSARYLDRMAAQVRVELVPQTFRVQYAGGANEPEYHRQAQLACKAETTDDFAIITYSITKREVVSRRRMLLLHALIDHGVPLLIVVIAACSTDWPAISTQAMKIFADSGGPPT